MPRQSLPITPVSSPHPHTPSPRGGNAQALVALCKLDEHMMRLIPSWKPLDAEGLRQFLFLSGATEDTLESTLQAYNQSVELKMRREGVRVIGVKPQPGDPNVYTIPIPNSPYCLRMWTGGMDYWGQFCLDFFDTERKVPVNLPAGYALYPGLSSVPPGAVGHALPPERAHLQPVEEGEPLHSWERNMGMASIPEGEEKWSIPEGMHLMLRRRGLPDFMFQMPARRAPVVFAQPRMGYPYY
ncbi:hypothetical protein GSI_02627 [Ganoderma sinense ZZ0214-1]|uniref:Uncharacterized protein n=1 Tax=Ganoderma sinense ZZ0214-1 TaxID=1077348 RepID=A0A2G8SM62_9APHY|nr:hypothetical protein GSI_02627 [Ganoderma sinense ZZ0214-1]